MIVEFVVPLPFSLEEYNRGQLFFTALMSDETTTSDGGVEIVLNEPFNNLDGHWGVSPITGVTVPRTQGQYTLKRYHIKSKFPSIVVAMLPENAMLLIEESWNAYPHIRTVLVNAYFAIDRFRIDIESSHIADDTGALENPLGFSPAELAERRRELIDIAVVGHDTADKEYKPENDPSLTKSLKSGRGPYAPGWFREAAAGGAPRLCVYKAARITFAYFPVQGTVEGMIASSQLRLFGRSMSAVSARVDEWFDMSLPDVRAYETTVSLKCKALIDAYLARSATPPTIPGAGYYRERTRDSGVATSTAAAESEGAPVTSPVASAAV